jgi:putative tryptophan/tyrosine transport system substrate-binding protein
MKRRAFIGLICGATSGWSVPAPAQRSGKARIIGFLGTNTASVQEQWTAAFVERLRQLGWAEGRDVIVEYRWAEGRSEQFTKIAAEFARLKADVIVTSGTPATIAAKRTTGIPIVFALSGDPVRIGLVSSLARPGGTVTGLTNQSKDAIARRLALLNEIVPGFQRLAITANAGNSDALHEMEDVQSMARALGLDVAAVLIRQSEDIGSAFERLNRCAQFLYVCTDSLVFNNRVRVNDLAEGTRLPTIYGFPVYVETGGLISYGANVTDLFRRAADYVDKILRGAKPADLPVQPPKKFDLFINLKTARTLGLDVPRSVLVRADEVIE